MSTDAKCRWCGQLENGNPGDYYHEKACHRKDVLRRMSVIEGQGDIEAMGRLERELFEASYTGD